MRSKFERPAPTPCVKCSSVKRLAPIAKVPRGNPEGALAKRSREYADKAPEARIYTYFSQGLAHGNYVKKAALEDCAERLLARSDS